MVSVFQLIYNSPCKWIHQTSIKQSVPLLFCVLVPSVLCTNVWVSMLEPCVLLLVMFLVCWDFMLHVQFFCLYLFLCSLVLSYFVLCVPVCFLCVVTWCSLVLVHCFPCTSVFSWLLVPFVLCTNVLSCLVCSVSVSVYVISTMMTAPGERQGDSSVVLGGSLHASHIQHSGI